MRLIAISLAVLLAAALACSAPPPFGPTPTICPQATAEPLWVEPVPATTGETAIVVEVYIGNGEAVTVSAESGVFTALGDFGAAHPARVEVALLPDTSHHLEVSARVAVFGPPDGCQYGGYTLQTTMDRDGGELIIAQAASTLTPCPVGTQAPLYVDPLPPATDQLSVVVQVYHVTPGQVTITAESGTFAQELPASGPAQVEVTLLPGVTHHLRVTADIPLTGPPNCPSGGYTINTETDSQGAPLVIVQASAPG